MQERLFSLQVLALHEGADEVPEGGLERRRTFLHSSGVEGDAVPCSSVFRKTERVRRCSGSSGTFRLAHLSSSSSRPALPAPDAIWSRFDTSREGPATPSPFRTGVPGDPVTGSSSCVVKQFTCVVFRPSFMRTRAFAGQWDATCIDPAEPVLGSCGVPDSCTGVRQASAICCAGNQDAGPVFSFASRSGRVTAYRHGRPNGISRGR